MNTPEQENPNPSETSETELTSQEENQQESANQETDLAQELEKMKDQWLRSVAEMENIRRRAQKDREDAGKYAVTSFARDLLSVSDNLMRALESIQGQDNLSEPVKALINGIEMTQKELATAFERQSIVKVNPTQQKFDPNLHQAMFEIENDDVEPGTVLQVLQSGYTLHDRLLRPALVGVSKKTTISLG